MVLMPPGSAKTMYSSVLWPPWILAQKRNLCIIATSHTDDLAQENSRKSIEVARQNENLLGFRLTRDSSKQWQTSNGGVYKAAGVGGPITGRRADICLVSGTLVRTLAGELPIENVEVGSSTGVVLSYGTAPTYRRVIAVARRASDDIWKIRTSAGRVVEATGNHRFFTKRGWTPASSLVVGDALLRVVQSTSCSEGLRRCEGCAQGQDGVVLQSVLREEWDECEGGDRPACMRGLRRFDVGGSPLADIVFDGLLGGSYSCAGEKAGKPDCAEELRDLRRGVSTDQQFHAGAVLLSSLQEQGSQQGHFGDTQPGLASWDRDGSRRHSGVVRSEKAGLGTGFPAVRGVQLDDAAGGASHQHGTDGSPVGKPCGSLSGVSSQAACCGAFEAEIDFVSVVERVRGEREVIDIQVQDTECFFANDILVHNCLIDDPVKDVAEAESPQFRNMTWNWYTSVLMTRLKPGGSVVLIMCLAGDTLVEMWDGSRRRIDEIEAGELVKSWNGRDYVGSVVSASIDNGIDATRLIMTTGSSVRANARHPFLVIDGDGMRWVRVRDLRRGMRIVRHGTGRIGELSVRWKDAPGRRNAAGCAPAITKKRNGLLGAGHRLAMLLVGWRRGGVGDTGLSLPSMIGFLRSRVGFARSASRTGAEGGRSIGWSRWWRTTTTRPARFVDCFATTATGSLDELEIPAFWNVPSSMSGAATEEVLSVEEWGRERVYDLTVEGTHNFIANGLLTHNTRWHEDDLGGRLLDRQRDRWKVINLQAQCLEAGDPLGRRPGEFLWSDAYGTDGRSFAEDLADKKQELTESGSLRVWEALFQQNPRPGEGALFQTRRIGYVDAAPLGGSLVRGWDLAATADNGSGNPDWTVGVLMQRTEEGAFIVRDVERFRGGPDRVEQMIVATAQADGSRVTVGLAQDPGAAGKAWNLHITKKLQGFKVRSSPETGDKATRAAAFASQVNAGNVSLVRGGWNHAYTDELSGFPSTAKDDQVDASSRAFNELIQPGFGAKVVRLLHMAR